MKIINNIDLICQSKIFWNPDIYKSGKHAYCVSIIKRMKDNMPDDIINLKYNFICDIFLIYDKESLKEKMPYIIKFCDTYNARAYLTLNPVDISLMYKNFTYMCLNGLTKSYEMPGMERFYNGNNFMDTSIINSEVLYYYMADCDTLIPEEQKKVRNTINMFYDENMIVDMFPTINGIHYIIKSPFNTTLYNETIEKSGISAHCVPNPRILIYYKSLK